ncbi:MAG: helix-turn-helix domain-containing protein [Stellaceae bacterium]
MDAQLIVIENDADLERAQALVSRLMDATAPAALARLEAQARLVEAYERKKWPRRRPNVADTLAYLMDQHGLTRADLVPLLGSPSRVSEVLNGKIGVSLSMIRRLRARFGISADILIPDEPPGKPARPAPRRKRAR